MTGSAASYFLYHTPQGRRLLPPSVRRQVDPEFKAAEDLERVAGQLRALTHPRAGRVDIRRFRSLEAEGRRLLRAAAAKPEPRRGERWWERRL
jgi:hypothetical protein